MTLRLGDCSDDSRYDAWTRVVERIYREQVGHAWSHYLFRLLRAVFTTNPQGLRLVDEVVGVPNAILAGISVGSVFMGANSYIGNAPNFMVKSIAEEAGVKMPSFFGYMLHSAVILVPLYLAFTWLFF